MLARFSNGVILLSFHGVSTVAPLKDLLRNVSAATFESCPDEILSGIEYCQKAVYDSPEMIAVID